MTDFFGQNFKGTLSACQEKKAFWRIFYTVPDRRRRMKTIQFPQNPNIIKREIAGRFQCDREGSNMGMRPFREGNIGLFPFGSKCLWQLTGGSDQP